MSQANFHHSLALILHKVPIEFDTRGSALDPAGRAAVTVAISCVCEPCLTFIPNLVLTVDVSLVPSLSIM